MFEVVASMSDFEMVLCAECCISKSGQALLFFQPLGSTWYTALEKAATLHSQDNNHVRKADKEEVQQLLAPGALIIFDPLKDLEPLASLNEVFEMQGKIVFVHSGV